MSEQVNTSNIHRLHEVIKQQQVMLSEHRERIQRLEGNVALMIAEVQNAKQLAAHLAGRGMGSTVNANGDND